VELRGSTHLDFSSFESRLSPWSDSTNRTRRFNPKFIGAVGLARYTAGYTGPEEQGSGEVAKSAGALRIAVLHEEHGVRGIFLLREELA
jgi:hypothetical protein